MNIEEQLKSMYIGEIRVIDFEQAAMDGVYNSIPYEIVCVPGGWLIEDTFVPHMEITRVMIDKDDLI